MIPLILLVVGLFTVFLEFYLPGGIMGTLGGIIVIASVVFFALQSESIIATFLFIIGACTAFGLMIKFALWRIRHAGPGYGIYSDADQEGFHASKFDASAIGKTGTVSTDLKPSGHVMIEGKRYSAVSQSGYVVKGAEVKVIAGEGETLIVKSVNKKG